MNKIITQIIVVSLALATLSVVADEKTPATADISRADLLDRIHGGWAGMRSTGRLR